MAIVFSPVVMLKILCDLCVVGWNLSPVLLQLEVAPVSNTEEFLSPRLGVTYLCVACSCDDPSSSTWISSGVY